MLVVQCLVRTLFLVPRHCLLSVSSPGRRSKGISFIRTLIPPPEAFLLASGEESAYQIPESLVDYSPCGHKRAGHDLATKGQSHLPKILPPNTITLGIRFQHTNGCGAGVTNIQFVFLGLEASLLKCWGGWGHSSKGNISAKDLRREWAG